MADQLVLTQKKDHVVWVRLNRPDQRNAFNAEMIKQVTKVFRSINAKGPERAVVLSGEGLSFCAGADLDWMKNSIKLSKAQNQKDATELFDMFQAVKDCPLPVITKVHGHAMGGGLGLVAASDIVVAEHDTVFCFSEVKLGLVPAVISSFVKDKIPTNYLYEYLLTGRTFDGDKALQMGLVNFSARELEIINYMNELLSAFRRAGPEAVRETKSLLRALSTVSSTKLKSLCVKTISERRVSAEAQEGLGSFFKKTNAKWVIDDKSKN